MRKALFKETISYFKKAHENIFIQFKDGTVHLSEGHIICSMPVEYYTAFIIPKIAGLPRYEKDETYIIKKDNRLVMSTVDFSEMYNKTGEQIEGKITPIMINQDKFDLRLITWMDGEIKGTLVNETFFRISKEYTCGTYYCTRKNAPVVTKNGDFRFMMLPVNYTDTSYCNMILQGFNALETEKAA